jgi:hypothetical protein
LAGCLARPIHIKDEEVVPLPVEQPAWLLLFFQRTSEQIFEKQGAQGLDCALIKSREKARERRTSRQTISSEERHECALPRLETLVEAFQRSFTTDGIAEEYGEKIDELVPSEATTSKAHLL